jgi:hypothetical protein
MGTDPYARSTIYIGGKIKKELLPDFIKVLHEESLIDDTYLQDRYKILGHIAVGKLVFTALNLDAWFSILEPWLVDKKIPFFRESDGYQDGEWYIQPQIAYWVEGMEKQKGVTTDADYYPTVLVHVLSDLLQGISKVGSIEEAATLITKDDTIEKEYALHVLQVGKIDPIGYLKSYIEKYHTVPEIPAFEIV